MSLDMIYRELILEHYRNPQNFGELKNPTARAKDYNPSCGDEIQMDFCIKENKICDVRFCGKGCAISQAAASMLTGLMKNKALDEVARMTKEDVLETIGIELSPVRLKCALLALKVAKLGIYGITHDEQKITDEFDF